MYDGYAELSGREELYDDELRYGLLEVDEVGTRELDRDRRRTTGAVARDLERKDMISLFVLMISINFWWILFLYKSRHNFILFSVEKNVDKSSVVCFAASKNITDLPMVIQSFNRLTKA